MTPQLFGRISERNVTRMLTNHGRRVSQQGPHGQFDLLVDRVYRVEVKAARPLVQKGYLIWKVNIHRHGELLEDCDFYVIRLEEVPFSKAAIHLLLRAPIGKKTIDISFRSLLSSWAEAVSDFHRFARGEMVARRVA